MTYGDVGRHTVAHGGSWPTAAPAREGAARFHLLQGVHLCLLGERLFGSNIFVCKKKKKSYRVL